VKRSGVVADEALAVKHLAPGVTTFEHQRRRLNSRARNDRKQPLGITRTKINAIKIFAATPVGVTSCAHTAAPLALCAALTTRTVCKGAFMPKNRYSSKASEKISAQQSL
jgi:hypothetical protein